VDALAEDEKQGGRDERSAMQPLTFFSRNPTNRTNSFCWQVLQLDGDASGGLPLGTVSGAWNSEQRGAAAA